MCELCDNENIKIVADVYGESMETYENQFIFSSEQGVGLMYCPLCGKFLNEINIERNKKKLKFVSDPTEIKPFQMHYVNGSSVTALSDKIKMNEEKAERNESINV